jgi:hypothetical protein
MLMTTTPAVADFSPQVENPAEHYREVVVGETGDSAQSPDLDAQSLELTTEPPKPEAQPVELSEEDKAERLWWDKVLVLGRIKDCARLIQETEGEIDGYQEQIKEAKEVLKGQQALLNRYSSQLADILDGHPLPKHPQIATETTQEAGEDGGEDDVTDGDDWRSMPTRKLLEGIKGMGAKKLDAICELAPTAGALEDLRGEASRSFKLFKEILPKGCGEAMADEIENRLIERVRYDEPKASETETESDNA